MRIASFLVLIVSLFFTKSTLGQDVLQPVQKGWERIYIKDVGYFDLPPTMEIQEGKYKEFADDMRQIHGLDAPRIVAQQIGVNDFNSEGLKKYSRIILETMMGEPDEYYRSNFEKSFYSPQELLLTENLMNDLLKNAVLNSSDVLEGRVKIIQWDPVKIEKINGQFCFHISCRRQLLDRPIVSYNKYLFQNFDRMYSLTLEYRENESDLWKADFEKVLDSFRITNLK